MSFIVYFSLGSGCLLLCFCGLVHRDDAAELAGNEEVSAGGGRMDFMSHNFENDHSRECAKLALFSSSASLIFNRQGVI